MYIYIYISIYTVANKPASLVDFLRIINGGGVRCVLGPLFQKKTRCDFCSGMAWTSRRAMLASLLVKKLRRALKPWCFLRTLNRNCRKWEWHIPPRGLWNGTLFWGKQTIYTNVWYVFSPDAFWGFFAHGNVMFIQVASCLKEFDSCLKWGDMALTPKFLDRQSKPTNGKYHRTIVFLKWYLYLILIDQHHEIIYIMYFWGEHVPL